MKPAAALVALLIVAACSTPAPARLVSAAGIRSAGLGGGLGWVFQGGGFLVTQDGGDHWTRLPGPPNVGQGTSTAQVVNAAAAWVAWIDPANNRVVHVARTRSAGVHWDTSTVRLGSVPAHRVSLSFANAQIGWLVTDEQQTMNSDFGQLFATADGGATWTERPAVTGKSVLLLASGRGFAVSAPAFRLWTSAGAGADWTPVTARTVSASLPSFVDARHGLYASGADIYRSDDGGDSWRAVGHILGAGGQPATRLAAAGRSRWFALSYNPTRLWRTTDSGATWSAVPASGLGPVGADGLWFDGDTGWALSLSVGWCAVGKTQCSTRAIFMRTRDGGHSWYDLAPTG